MFAALGPCSMTPLRLGSARLRTAGSESVAQLFFGVSGCRARAQHTQTGRGVAQDGSPLHQSWPWLFYSLFYTWSWTPHRASRSHVMMESMGTGRHSNSAKRSCECFVQSFQARQGCACVGMQQCRGRKHASAYCGRSCRRCSRPLTTQDRRRHTQLSAFRSLLGSLPGGGVPRPLCLVQQAWPMLERSGCNDLSNTGHSAHAALRGRCLTTRVDDHAPVEARQLQEEQIELAVASAD